MHLEYPEGMRPPLPRPTGVNISTLNENYSQSYVKCTPTLCQVVDNLLISHRLKPVDILLIADY